MGSIAEGFVFGMAAAAEGHAIAYLYLFTVRALYRDTAGDPVRAVGDDGDTLRQVRLKGLSRRGDLIGERSGRAALDHGDDPRADGHVIGVFGHLPDVPSAVFAEG